MGGLRLTPPADPAPLSDFTAALREQWGLTGPATPLTDEQIEQQTQQAIAAQRMAAWQERCPPEFQKGINRSKIPNVAAWDAADKWEATFPGLWLWSHGTGRCKSRMLWRQFGRLHVKRGRSVAYWSGKILGDAYKDAYFSSRTERFFRDVCFPAVVMIDDLDKLDLRQTENGADTPRMLREVFNHLYEANKPTLVTSNEPISYFEEKLGASCARRMREVCKEIEF